MGAKKIATNIPEELLLEARKLTGLNQTSVLTEGLKALIAQEKRTGLVALRGKLTIDYSPEESRQRRKS